MAPIFTPKLPPQVDSSQPVASTVRDLVAYDATLQSARPLPQAPPLAAGTLIGERYEIEAHVSSGGFGAVYRATDRQIRNHRVALKLLHEPAADEQTRKAALRELTLLASISHPSVAQFKDYGWHLDRLWFAMPWYRGATLAQRYGSPNHVLTRALARPIFERSARGLAAMHEVGICHCDIKPDNIFLADVAGFDEGLPVLLDLGIASTRDEGPRGMTVEYTAPETAAGALGTRTPGAGPAADVFALALVMRNLLEPNTAQRMKNEPLAFLQRRASEPVPAPRGREFRHLEASFARWLHLEPTQRPSAAEFANELALLTAPDEQRAARMRLLRRLGPLAALVSLLVLFLVAQVRKESRELRYERALLDLQRKTTDELRAQSVQQLHMLEVESKAAGDDDRILRRATLNARQFKALLERSEQRNSALERRVRELTAEHDATQPARDRAPTELTTTPGVAPPTAATRSAP